MCGFNSVPTTGLTVSEAPKGSLRWAHSLPTGKAEFEKFILLIPRPIPTSPGTNPEVDWVLPSPAPSGPVL